ncbi:molybdopterin converting factor subunit 1 [Salirhabdus salicampi]|uniref:molybdopterin converting factor subunit 1 n=1 Tax=Salirhabdus salicampi TaxID=476102 RepID=UPI0020C2AE84|nr:molybdopterin converting factor subunit 1 [Salirhabdus salicampi]MCP8615643.1 molybdopterin converting factor subunit 1 [Salirhabdus salicampi]
MIKVLLFAHLQEEAGSNEVELELDGMTVSHLKRELQQRYQLSEMDQVMVAINEEYALDEDKVKNGDIVALIPPVSGG